MSFIDDLKKCVEERQRALGEAIELLKWDPQAAALLDMARADGVRIIVAAELANSGALAQYSMDSSGRKKIKVSPDYYSIPSLAGSLAHELRHYWQHKKLGLTAKGRLRIDMDPRLSFVFNRVIEADANAFAKRFRGTITERYEAKDRLIDKILDCEQAGLAPAAGDAARFLEEIEREVLKGRQTDKELMGATFREWMKDSALLSGYDKDNALRSRMLHMPGKKEYQNAFKDVKDLPVVTIADIRGILKTDVKEGASGYLDEISDRQFEALVLRHAHKGARKVVRLIDKFNRASAANDNKAAEKLRACVQEKMKSFRPAA